MKGVLVDKDKLEQLVGNYQAMKDANAELRVLLTDKKTTIAELWLELEKKDALLREARLTIECAMHEIAKPKICYLDIKG